MALVQPQSDIAALWAEALDSYTDVAKVDIRSILSSQRSTTSIMMEQQHQLETFKVFRHDKGKLDKLRSMISSNADIVQSITKHVADAASAAFPPSSAILTAFTYVMNASKHVSEDYDMIEGFFSIMQSFLQRLSLLENKIPPQRAFQKFLINVFSSLMKLSALARSYCTKGRLMKWAKALVDGKDPDLNAAYGTLNENLQRLESATIIQTLTTIEISEQAKTINQNVKALQGQLDRNTAITVQTLETTEQTLMVAMQTNVGMQEVVHSRDTANASAELLRRSEDIMKRLNKMHSKDNEEKRRNLKSGASRPVNFDRLKDWLRNPAEHGITERLNDLELSYVDRLFEWIDNDPTFESIIDGDECLLWASGTSGMGKSTLTFRMHRYLEKKYSYDTTTCVACFFFDEEHPEMRSVLNMLKHCSIRAAEKDAGYCAETLTDFLHHGWLQGADDAWTRLIETKFPKESDRRLILILDGIDETSDEQFSKLVEFFGKIKSQKCKVQVIWTSDPNKNELSGLEAKRIDLNRDKVARDMHRFAWSQAKTLSRLRKLRATLRKTIIRRVVRAADSFLYIDHTMRRLNAVGREGPILKELDNLPENITAIYNALLKDCQKNRTSEERELLRNLLAWLAYTKSKFTVGEANRLIDIIKKENSISIEEELEGRLSRLLRISGNRVENDQDDSSDNESDIDQMSEDNTEIQENAEDMNNFLSFQERSLKSYFRQAIHDQPDGLRCTATEAQVIIFRTISAILTMPKKNQTYAEGGLVSYAIEWGISHLLEIDANNGDSVNDELAKVIIESIFNIFTNKNDSLKPLEQRNARLSTIFSGYDFAQEDVLAALSGWAKRTLRLPPNELSYGVLDWFRPLAQEPLRVFISLSRAHIINWFSSMNRFEAYSAFGSAHFALQEGRNLPELKQNPTLKGYFEDFKQCGEIFTERSFETVANSFWDIVKTSSSFRGIGMAMKNVDLYEPAVKQLNIGLEDGTIDDLERFRLLESKGEALLWLGRRETGEEKRRKYLEESLSTLEQANELYRNMDATNQADQEIKEGASFAFQDTAHVAALLGRSDLVLQRITEQINTKIPLDTDTLTAVISALKEAGQLTMVMELFKIVNKTDFIWYFIDNDAEAAQEAAKRLDQGQYMLDLYNVAMKTVETWPSYSGESKLRIQLQAATFARGVLDNLDLAKTLLRDIIDSPKSPDWRVAEASNRLTEILFENFRLSKDPLVKSNALDETRKLLDKLAEVLPNSFDAAESHITVNVALMLRRLGPALECSDRLHAAFRNCIENLQDNTSANDSTAFRRLARVLSCVPGFERDASISLTAQFYIVDEEVHRKELEDRRAFEENLTQASNAGKEELADGAKIESDLKVENDGPGALDSIDTIVNGGGTDSVPNSVEIPSGDISAPADGTAKTPVGNNQASEALLDNTAFWCDFCRKTVRDWTQGGAYYCVYCIDCGICEECFMKKVAREKGELEQDWRVICPQGHRHVKAPIEGWRGVKEGKLRIGPEEVAFKTWLAQLEMRWAKYWDMFWADTEGM